VIRPATTDDAGAIARIYDHYIRETVVTFEEEAVPASEMARRIETVLSASLPYLVAVETEGVVGYAYAGRWHARSAYRFSVETTIYLDAAAVGRGLGTALYGALFEDLAQRGLHVAIGGIALPNAASVALHEKLGFRKAAHYDEVGFKFGRWIDVGYWQRRI
jgi:phosphinothricin acetyltransferase